MATVNIVLQVEYFQKESVLTLIKPDITHEISYTVL